MPGLEAFVPKRCGSAEGQLHVLVSQGGGRIGLGTYLNVMPY